MLKIFIDKKELFDNNKQEFIYIDKTELLLEHSLISISKWESKWKKPFLSKNKKDDKTSEEIIDYIRCMSLKDDIDDNVYNYLTDNNISAINEYIKDNMTATSFTNIDTFGEKNSIITSELIYYWMISYNIPIECEKWHINRLLTLIRIFSIKNATPKKMSKREIINRNAALNAARKIQLNTKRIGV